MKKSILTLILTLLVCQMASPNIVYVDHNDAVYWNTSATFTFDLNSDGGNDINLQFNTSGSTTCNVTTCATSYTCQFVGLVNSYGQNRVGGISSGFFPAIDCTGDTIDLLDSWSIYGRPWKGCDPSDASSLCYFIGYGSHKEAFRIVKTNPATSSLGYLYGYIDYSLGTTGEIIIHGWYYEDEFNVPIVANSLLDYPYNGGCIHYDTIPVYDTITTYQTVEVYDTITTYISVTDTLIINTSLVGVNAGIINTTKIYPNPTNDKITIDFGQYTLLNGYSVSIENSIGQEIYYQIVSTQSVELNISEWGSLGIYFVKIKDQQSNVVNTHKILLE